MKRVIIIRVCEIFLKGKNRFYFLNLLEEHVKKALTGINFKLEKLQMRYLVEDFDESDFQAIIDKLKKVSGVHTISPAYSVDSDYEKIKEVVVPLCEDFRGSFKVETNRADKTFPIPSVELSRMLGGEILSLYGKNIYVDVKKPANIVKIDMRENGKSLIYTQTIKCVGGMPIGSSGHGFLMLSGGIDSPVAGYMMCSGNVVKLFVHLLGSAPVVCRACIFFVSCANKGTVLNTCNIVRISSVQIAAGKLFFIKLHHFSCCNRKAAKLFKLLLAKRSLGYNGTFKV